MFPKLPWRQHDNRAYKLLVSIGQREQQSRKVVQYFGVRPRLEAMREICPTGPSVCKILTLQIRRAFVAV